MKNNKLLLASVIAMMLSPVARGYDIVDDYVGSNDHGWGDVIGSASQFDVFGADLYSSGSNLLVSVQTNFAGRGDDKLFTSSTETDHSKLGGINMGIGYGDLFLDSAWNPNGVGPSYLADDYATGTQWGYVFSLDNRWSATGGTGNLYALTANDPAVLLSDDFLSGGTFRNGQEVAIDPSTASLGPALATGSWFVDAVSKRILFAMDLSATTLSVDSDIALHWNMTCGNDTIEGSATPMKVPEPSTLPILGLGLVGLLYRRACAVPNSTNT